MDTKLERLDVALQSRYPSLSRSLIQKLIKSGYVKVNGEVIQKSGALLKGAENLELKTDVMNQEVEELQLDVLYEDENCVVVHKPTGVLTHSKGAFNPESTVASWLKNRPHYSFSADEERGGIVHRLDRATSGVILCAKNKATLGMLQKQFQNRTVKKIYAAKVEGIFKEKQALIDLPIERNPKKPQTFRVGVNGKSSQTEYRVLQEGKNESLVELIAKTGRTHQLRVHLQYISHPIVGDTLYGGKKAERLFLHAKTLEITIPGGIRKIFNAPEPKLFHEVA